MNFNINDEVTVTLTKTGAATMNEIEAGCNKVWKEGDKLTDQLHGIVSTFRRYPWLSNRPFEAEIELHAPRTKDRFRCSDADEPDPDFVHWRPGDVFRYKLSKWDLQFAEFLRTHKLSDKDIACVVDGVIDRLINNVKKGRI